VLAWGRFLTLAINFVIIAVVLFFVVRLMNRMLRAEAEKTPALSKPEQLLTEIRDALRTPLQQASRT
jgi:large conductance mechanosensitive channel